MFAFLVTPASLAISAVAGLLAFLDPAWAPTMNTFLVILLAMFQAWQAGKLRTVELAARDAKRAAGADNRNGWYPDSGERRRVTDK